MSNSYSNSFHKLTAFFILTIIFSSNFSVFAQARGGGKTVASNSPKATAKCTSGAWTGTISYTRTQTLTNNKTVERVSGRGQDTTNFQMDYNYKAQVAVVESPEKNGSSIGKATIDHKMSSTETVSAKEKNSCDRGKTWQEMSGNSTSKTETTGNEKADANVNVGINSDGTYTVSVGLPQIKGKTAGSQTSSFSGQCTPKEGKTFNLPPTETSIDGNSLTSDGTNRVNPSDPNRLSGSYSKTWQNVTETITWNLQKCGAPLRITDFKFEDMKFPNWNDWQEISEQIGTTDGNFVKIKATILNASGETKYADVKFKETYKGDKWDGAKPDGLLENGAISVKLDAGESKDVEMLWDSSGYAWYDDGRPRLVQRIKAELEENGGKVDEQTKNLKVAPKPVVLVHGLWSNWKRFESWQNILTTSHSYDWKAFPVGEKPSNGVLDTGGEFLSGKQGKTVSENAAQLKSYIEYAQKDRNAWHVDVVAHSTGGLIARNYINSMMPPAYQDGRPQIAHLLMLGTPNLGSPCADTFYSQNQSLYQATTEFAATFNKTNINRKGVKFSALAGEVLPTMCYKIEWNDGFVHVPSAKWTVADSATSKSIHTDLTSTKDFSDFVKPRLAIGPKGNHNPEMPTITGQTKTNQNPFGIMFIGAAYKSGPAASADNSSTDWNAEEDGVNKPDFAKAVKLAPKQSIEVEIPVEAANNFGLTFMASNEISATLYNDKGEIVGKNLTKTPEANAWFRSIFVDKNVTGGTWKLKLENTSDRELEAILAAWKNAVK